MASIKDVAKKSGYSIGTVSKAFNEYADISQETREKILAIARELDYTPCANARNLASKKKTNIGLIVSGFLDAESNKDILFGHLKGCFQFAYERSIDLAFYVTNADEQKKISLKKFCYEHSLNGIILSGLTTDDEYYKELEKGIDIPAVTIDINIPNSSVGFVSVDNRKACKLMAKYLLDHGHEKIAIMAGKKNATVNKERLLGVQDAFEERGISLDWHDIYYSDFSREKAGVITKEILNTSKKNEYTAFLAFSDSTAIGIINALVNLGFKVPNDYSVTGFDDTPEAMYIKPGLTTVNQDFEKAGYQAVKLIFEKMNEVESFNTSFVDAHIVERRSVSNI